MKPACVKGCADSSAMDGVGGKNIRLAAIKGTHGPDQPYRRLWPVVMPRTTMSKLHDKLGMVTVIEAL